MTVPATREKEEPVSVGRICVRTVIVADPKETARDAARRMTREGVGALVVVDDARRPIGIVTDRDLMARCVADGLDPAATALAAVMSAPARTVRESTEIEEALKLMARIHVRRLPVVDPEDRLVGILSLDDVLDLLAEESATIGRLLARARTRPGGSR